MEVSIPHTVLLVAAHTILTQSVTQNDSSTVHNGAGLTPAKVPHDKKWSRGIIESRLDMSRYVLIIYANGCNQDQFKS